MALAGQTKAKSGNITRVLWREIRQGDRRKFSATSNDTQSGGGARDLRFRGDEELENIIVAMFPHAESAIRRRESGGQVTVYRGTFCWNVEVSGNVVTRSVPAYMEPPTDTRPTEWRIPRVHTYEVFQAPIPPDALNDRVLLLLIQTKDGNIWPRFATESSLRNDSRWSKAVQAHIVHCLNRQKTTSKALYGFIDLQTKHEYCNV